MSEYGKEGARRLAIWEVEKDVNYAMIINSNAGLWGYDLGDTVRFSSIRPYKVRVTGRVKHFISAFGEHVIGEEVDRSLLESANELGIQVTEFTVAPQVNPAEGGLPYHEWFIEFAEQVDEIDTLMELMDQKLCEQNVYYRDLIEGKILRPLKITKVKKDGFVQFMKARGKLGGQNKTPRLSNDRKIANELQPFIEN